MLFWVLVTLAAMSATALFFIFAMKVFLPPLSIIFPVIILLVAPSLTVIGGVSSYFLSVSMMSSGTALFDNANCSYESLSEAAAALSTSGMSGDYYHRDDIDRLDRAMLNIEICVQNTRTVKYWRSDEHPMSGAQVLPYFYSKDIPEYMEKFEVFVK